MATRKRLQTSIPGFGCIFRPWYYTKTGEKRQQSVWWMEYQTRDGKVRRSAKTTDQEAAYNELAKLHGRKASGQMLGKSPERVTFGTLFDLLIEDYAETGKATLADMTARVDSQLRPVFGDTRVIDLRKEDFTRWIRDRRKAGASDGTINKLIAYLIRSLNLGAEQDPPLVIAFPKWLKKLDWDNERTGTVTHEMYRKLVSSFAVESEHARLAFVIGYHVGLRKGAILSLKWDWVNWADGVITIPAPKRATNKNKPRHVPIYGEMRSYLEMAYAQWQSSPQCPYIVQYEGKRVFSIKRSIETAFRVSGLLKDSGKTISSGKRKGQPLLKPAALFHDLRRTAATNLHDAGHDLADIMEICGWKSVDMPKRYIQQSAKRVRDIGRTMEAFMERQESGRSKGAVQ